MAHNQKGRENWSGRIGFIFAAVGSAVGLGNLWKFPYVTWKNGGGVFVLIYIICVILIGLPIMISEIALGKISRQDSFGTFKKIEPVRSPFRFLGFLGIASSFVLLSYYSVIAGWSFEYQLKSYQNEFKEVKLSQIYEILSKDIALSQKKEFGEVKNSKQEVSLEGIHYMITNSEARIATSIKEKAFLEALSRPLPENISKKLLHDIPILKHHNKLTSSEIKSTLIDYVGSSDLNHNKVVRRWYEYFYAEKKESSHYQKWLQATFLPIYSSEKFNVFINDHPKLLLWHSVVMFIVCLITLFGIKNGIEQISKYGMIILLVILLVFMVNTLSLDWKYETFWFLVRGNPNKFSFGSITEALGHAFFTLSIGLGVMMTYGSYLREKENAVSSAAIIAFMDTAISIIACLVIFPIIFVQKMNPTEGGIGILFTTLPLEIFKFPGGKHLSLLFYVLILIAALTSAISLLEVVVTFFKDQLRMSRPHAVFISGFLIYLAGIPSALSLGFLGVADTIVSNFLLPIGGLTVALFVGYRINIDIIKNEFIQNGYSLKLFQLFKISIRYVSPVLLLFVLYSLVHQIFLN